MSAPAVMFDMDGTLVDTAPDLIVALNHTLHKWGFDSVEPGLAKSMIGHGAAAMIRQGLIHLGEDVAQSQLLEMERVFMDYYYVHFAENCAPYPGLEACLEDLLAHEAKLGVCTNSPEKLARVILDEMGLSHYFIAISGGDTFAGKKPDPVHLGGTIALAGAEAGNCVMVGDSETDIKAARNMALPVVAVGFGYSNTPIQRFSPDEVIGHYQELIPILERLKPDMFGWA